METTPHGSGLQEKADQRDVPPGGSAAELSSQVPVSREAAPGRTRMSSLSVSPHTTARTTSSSTTEQHSAPRNEHRLQQPPGASSYCPEETCAHLRDPPPLHHRPATPRPRPAPALPPRRPGGLRPRPADRPPVPPRLTESARVRGILDALCLEPERGCRPGRQWRAGSVVRWPDVGGRCGAGFDKARPVSLVPTGTGAPYGSPGPTSSSATVRRVDDRCEKESVVNTVGPRLARAR